MIGKEPGTTGGLNAIVLLTLPKLVPFHLKRKQLTLKHAVHESAHSPSLRRFCADVFESVLVTMTSPRGNKVHAMAPVNLPCGTLRSYSRLTVSRFVSMNSSNKSSGCISFSPESVFRYASLLNY